MKFKSAYRKKDRLKAQIETRVCRVRRSRWVAKSQKKKSKIIICKKKMNFTDKTPNPKIGEHTNISKVWKIRNVGVQSDRRIMLQISS